MTESEIAAGFEADAEAAEYARNRAAEDADAERHAAWEQAENDELLCGNPPQPSKNWKTRSKSV